MKQGWEMNQLGEICKISTGKSNTVDAVENGEYAFFDRSKKVKRSSKYLFDCDAIIIAGEGQTFLPKFYSGKFDLHQRAYALFNFIPNIDIHYVYIYLIHFHKYFEKVAVGATAKSLRLRHFQDLPIPIPSLNEQKRIVAKLDQCFEAIDKARVNVEKNLNNAKELFQSQLNEIFSQKGDGWVDKRLGELCEKIQDGAHHSPKVQYEEKSNNRYLYITSKNIRNNYLDLSNISYVDESFHNTIYPRCNPEVGDILITKDGANTGNITLNTLEEPFSLLSSVCLIKTNRKLLLPSFLKGYIQSPVGFKNITGKMTGTAIKRIILKTIKQAEIPLPDLNIQQEIVEQLDDLYEKTQSLESNYQQELDALDELKKSVLQKAFNGEL
jgi:type I restriction enzyme, S subunit